MKVLKFGAVWCPGCLVMRPMWQEIEKENQWLKNEYYDYDQDEKAVKKWHVDDTLPTFIFVDKYEKELFRLQGERSKQELLKLLLENKDK